MTERRPARGRPAIPGPRRRVQLTPGQDAFIARLAAKWGCGWPDALRRVLDVLQEAALIAEVERLRSEVERLRAIIPAPPKTPPPGEVWRHSGTFDIDGTDFAVDLVWVGAHRLIAYYPSNNQHLRNCCGYSPHPVIWMDGAIYWEDGLIATEQEEDFCGEVVEALIRYILEHGTLPDDFGDLGLDTFGRDVRLEVPHAQR